MNEYLKSCIRRMKESINVGNLTTQQAEDVGSIIEAYEDGPTPEAYKAARDAQMHLLDEVERLKGDLAGAQAARDAFSRAVDQEKGVRAHREQQLGAIMLICGK